MKDDRMTVEEPVSRPVIGYTLQAKDAPKES